MSSLFLTSRCPTLPAGPDSQKKLPGSQQRSPSATEREGAGSGPGEARDVGTGRPCYKCGICRKRWEEPHLAASGSLEQQAVPTGDRTRRLGRESLCLAVSTETSEGSTSQFLQESGSTAVLMRRQGRQASRSSWK